MLSMISADVLAQGRYSEKGNKRGSDLERERERERERGGREREREDAASGKWLLQPQAYPDTPKRHQGGEGERVPEREEKRERLGK